MSPNRRDADPAPGFSVLRNGKPTPLTELPVDERLAEILKVAAKSSAYDANSRDRLLGFLAAAAAGLPEAARAAAEASIAEARSRPLADGAPSIPRVYLPHIREVDRADGTNPLKEAVNVLALHEKTAMARLLMDAYVRAKRPLIGRRGYRVKTADGAPQRVPPLSSAEVETSIRTVGAFIAGRAEPSRGQMVARLEEARGRAPKRVTEVIDAILKAASGGRP